MATVETTALTVEAREAAGSRAARRLRRSGRVPGLVHGGAVLELSVAGGATTPVVVKELVRHPVSGETVHIDMLRVRMDQAITATVVLDLIGEEDAPGVKEGGVLEHVTRELTIEALPGDIPDSIQHDVSDVQIGDTITLEAVTPPSGVTLIDDPETVVATVSAPRLQVEPEAEIEEETELVAEGATPEEAEQAAGEEGAGESEGGTEGE